MAEGGDGFERLCGPLRLPHCCDPFFLRHLGSGGEDEDGGAEKEERGINVQQVTVVVNFSLPRDHRRHPVFETYLHRIGRTGHFGKKGVAFSMVERQDLWLIQLIEEHFQTRMKELDPNDMEELEKLEG